MEKHRNTIHPGKLRGKEKIRARVNKVVGNALLAYFAFEISDDHLQVDIVHKQSLLDELYSNLYKKLEKISTRVRQGKLKGKTKIRTSVKKLLNKTLMTLIKLEVRDDPFSFSVNDETRVKQEALAHLNHHLNHVVTLVQQGRYGDKDKIGLRVGKVINQYKMAKHFILTFTDDDFTFQRDADKVAAEAVLEGSYILRTSVSAEQLTAHDTVRTYKRLSQVERAFRSFNMPCLINYSRYKSMDLQVRPIHHRLENRVRGHIFLCMLAYYVEWHMKEAWWPLLFSDEDQEAKATRDPVAPATRSKSAQRKAATKMLDDGSAVHSFQSLLHQLSTIVRNSCRTIGEKAKVSIFEMTTTPDAKQRRSLGLIAEIKLEL